MLFCVEQYLQLGAHTTRDGGQGTDALPLRGGRFTSAVPQLFAREVEHVAS